MSGLAQVLERMRSRSPRIAVIQNRTNPAVAQAIERFAKYRLGEALVIGVDGIRPSDDRRLPQVASLLRERAPNRVRDGIHALDLGADPLLFGLGLTALGEIDICLVAPGVDFGLAEQGVSWLRVFGADWPSLGTIGYLQSDDDRWWSLATPSTDSADPKTLARLALAAADHRGRAIDETPRVAFLTRPPRADDGRQGLAEQALAEFRALAPGIAAQIDWLGPIGEPKPRGRPTVLVFPDRVSSHLATRFAREFGAVRLLGPLIPGAGRGLAGLPEEADADDIVAVTAILAAGLAGYQPEEQWASPRP